MERERQRDWEMTASLTAYDRCAVASQLSHSIPWESAYLLGGGHFPPPLLGEVCSHPLHLLQQVVPMGLGPRRLLQLGQSAG